MKCISCDNEATAVSQESGQTVWRCHQCTIQAEAFRNSGIYRFTGDCWPANPILANEASDAIEQRQETELEAKMEERRVIYRRILAKLTPEERDVLHERELLTHES